MLDNEDPVPTAESSGTDATANRVGNIMTEVRDFECEEHGSGTRYPERTLDGSPDRAQRSPISMGNDGHKNDAALDAPIIGVESSEASEYPKDGGNDLFVSDKRDQSTVSFLRSEPLRLHLEQPAHQTNVKAQTSSEQARPIPKVRFRSRVRITSGMRRHRQTDTNPSASSSVSGSPSSSISAPLRSYNTGSSKGWGPLGQRVSFFAWQNRDPDPSPSQGTKERRRRSQLNTSRAESPPADEGTSLLASASRPRYTESEGSASEESDAFAEDECVARRAKAIDEAFGVWPGRLLNHHWWWWQLEPVVCCHCVDYSDSED